MQIFHHHATTGIYLGSAVAAVDPLELQLAQAAAIAPLLDAARARLGEAVEAAEQDEELLARAYERFEQDSSAAKAVAAAVAPKHWLIPANATPIAPPAFGFDEHAVMTDMGWVIRPADDAGGDDPDPEPSQEELAASLRTRRDAEIAALRWFVERHRDEITLGVTTTLTAEDFILVLQHIQLLRDLPDQAGFPSDVEWPTLAPELIATAA